MTPNKGNELLQSLGENIKNLRGSRSQLLYWFLVLGIPENVPKIDSAISAM